MKHDKHNKRNLWQIFNRDRHTRTMGVLLLIAAVVMIWQEVRYIIPADVTVVYHGLDGKAMSQELVTRKSTVDDVLTEAGVKMTEIDRVSPIREHGIENGMTIDVTECIDATAKIGGQETEIVMTTGTVRDNLELNGIDYDKDDIVKPALTKKVDRKTKIVVDYVEKKTVEKTENVEPKDLVILDPSVASGTITETEGKAGEGVYTYTTTYVNGTKTGSEKKLKKWNSKPVDHVLRCGTSKTGESGEASIRETFISNTTAYYAGNNAHGATGARVHYGTCAVDPSVIPYGTRLYVEGYGIAVANDCGGAVKGHIIDLYMTSTGECIRWGRRDKQVYVLD